MGLYEQWKDLMGQDNTPEKMAAYDAYIERETEIYEQLLENHGTVEKGTFRELADKYGAKDILFTGFLDGISDSLAAPLDMDALTEDTPLSFDIDYRKLYLNMLRAKANWLYNMEQWDDILDQEARNELLKEHRTAGMAKSEKVGRNDPCPCGSGKKYKVCCGKAG